MVWYKTNFSFAIKFGATFTKKRKLITLASNVSYN